ncbi:response regulator [Paenibacillus pinistramenti]|uniref:response regulator n=1 Tax=Paenibacillus pinistramenti TaxID=1768003 RepID=UPI0011080A6B|nr:response regulator [Paenibacillus pinistramenti]
MIQILLVDDESYVTESLAETIDWASLDIGNVYQAASALQAVDLLEEHDIDIVVTDIRMPEMTGLELIKVISERWPGIKCILLTGYSDFEYAKQAVRLQAVDYILKPVEDEEFVKSVASAAASLKEEWEAANKYQQLLYSRRSDLQQLRMNLLHELALGSGLPKQRLYERLAEYDVSLKPDEETVMVFIQPGSHFAAMDMRSLELNEYAIGNIAEEALYDEFRSWFGKAPHDCLLLMLQHRSHASGLTKAAAQPASPASAPLSRDLLEGALLNLQQLVHKYLSGHISMVVTDSFSFPDETAEAYRRGISYMYSAGIGHGADLMFLEDQSPAEGVTVKPLESLYRPPTVLHLLESKQWEAAQAKIESVLEELAGQRHSREHLVEFFLTVNNAFMYMAHKQGRLISHVDQTGLGSDLMAASKVIYSVPKLREWALGMLDQLQNETPAGEAGARSHIVKQVQDMIEADHGHELSVKTIADQVFLHPVYLSKVYKAETGEGLGDYLIRKRMDKAAYLLKNSNKKIYEITSELGYQNPQYFSKMFRKHYGMTPNEFRDQ